MTVVSKVRQPTYQRYDLKTSVAHTHYPGDLQCGRPPAEVPPAPGPLPPPCPLQPGCGRGPRPPPARCQPRGGGPGRGGHPPHGGGGAGGQAACVLLHHHQVGCHCYVEEDHSIIVTRSAVEKHHSKLAWVDHDRKWTYEQYFNQVKPNEYNCHPQRKSQILILRFR